MEQVTSTRIEAAKGGTATSHDGKLSLTFAAGALAEDTDIRIETLGGLTDAELVTEAYELGPDGLTFAGSVALVLDAKGITDELEVVNLDGDEPVPVDGSVHDLEAGVIRAPLAHFSSYGGRRRHQPCAGLSCGDTCSPCNPNRPNCNPSGNWACNMAGACVPANAAMCGPPDAGISVDAGQPVDSGPRPDAGTPGVFDETEPNDTPAQANVPPPANPMQPIVTIHGGIFSPNDRDTFEVVVPRGNYRLDAHTYGVLGQSPTCGGIDTVLFLLDAQGNEIARNDDGGDGFCSLISQVLTAGTYYLQVGSFQSAIADYYLDFTLTPVNAFPDAGVPDTGPAPGTDAGTPPDAGNPTGFLVTEIEPNDTQNTAQAVTSNPMSGTHISAAIGTAGDVDTFVVQVNAPGQTVRARTYSDLGQPTSCNGIDTILRVYDARGGQLAQNDDISGQIRCSEVTVPASGVLYFEVTAFTGVIQQYYLELELQ